MKLGSSARKKSSSPSEPQVVIFTSPASGPGYSFATDVILAVTGGPMPQVLRPYVEPLGNRPILPDQKIFRINAAEFEQHVAAETRRQQAPPPAPESRWTRQDIINLVFAGDAAAFAAAGVLGFPAATGIRVNGRVNESFWRERTVREWAAQIHAVASALAR